MAKYLLNLLRHQIYNVAFKQSLLFLVSCVYWPHALLVQAWNYVILKSSRILESILKVWSFSTRRMSSTSIRLGSNDDRTLPRDDLSRAFFCSVAVYGSSTEEAEMLFRKTQREHPAVRFAKVHMSLDLPGEQKFLVAYADDAIFIAFRGTTTLEDVATNLKLANHSRFGGAFHSGFFKRTDVFVKPDCNPMLGLFSLQKRIIFCGHSLGGAVAHMVLFRLLVENNWNPNDEEFPNSLISIAFGAPHVCDRDAAQIINADVNLRWRFMNFVNQSDPVPRLLHSIAHTVGMVKKSLNSNEIFQKEFALGGIGTRLGQCIDGFTHGGFLQGVSAALMATFDIGMSKFAHTLSNMTFVQCLLELLAQQAAHMPGTSNYNQPDFYPIGYYIFVEKQSTAGYVRDHLRFNVHRIDDQSVYMMRKLQDVRFGYEDFEYHKLQSYKMVLIKSDLMDSAQVDSIQQHNFQINNVVSTPTPIITKAQYMFVDSTQQHIMITGDNLLFLSEPVKINNMETWLTKEQEDKKILVMRLGSLNNNPKINIIDVTVKTAFGQESQIVEGMENSPISIFEKIAKIVQITMIMKAFGMDPLPNDLSELDTIIQCAPSLQSEKLSPILMEGTHIQKANDMTKAVADFLSSGLEVSYKRTVAGRAIAINVSVAPAVSAICVSVPIATAVSAGLGAITSYGAKELSKFRVDDYKKILAIGCEEASKWITSELTSPVDANSENDVLEKELENRVEKSTNDFKKMVREAHLHPKRTWLSDSSPKLKHKDFKNSDPECRINLLKRMKIIVDTEHLFSQVVGRNQFWGILGAEDAGKSTFIKKALEHHHLLHLKPPPECGTEDHTSAVVPYKLADYIWLLDFPGLDGLQGNADKWTQFKELSNFCILVLQFLGDVKSGQKDMYKEVKEKLTTSEIKVIFNKVDLDFRPGWGVDYFERQKENCAKKLGCPKDNIYYACFEPTSNEHMQTLRRMGVLGFEDIFQKLGILEGR
ncbi:unnamed protein product [Sphagnum jensenii]|uniref:Fungal lipase-type domain-containing protein n=1 Tax=Sphagnum jensenii TaxID=128206 RepID=A0ABP1BYV1_9BRYO